MPSEGKGSQELMTDFKNLLSVKKSPNPALLVSKLDDIIEVLEDTYSISDEDDMSDAIDNIGDDAGSLFIEAGTITLSASIAINGGGSYVIYGHGDNTILQPAAGISVFNITDAESVVIKNLKLDLSNYSADTIGIIINEVANNTVKLENVTIVGGGTYGYGMDIQSNNVTIDNCAISQVKYGIYCSGTDKHIISNCSITSCNKHGIYLDQSDYSVIISNSISSNTEYGIYLTTCTYCSISGNIITSNTLSGMYLSACTNCTFSNNIVNQNSTNGMYFTNCDYCTIAANTCNANDSNTANSQAGIYITTDSDYNSITSNSCNNNNNSGAGVGYGILIDAITCAENVVASNNANGNDVDYKDTGTDTTIVYFVQDAAELQDAIDSIGSQSGIIKINAGTTTLSMAIDIDGGGSYIIEGQGDNTIIDINGDYKAFNITSARQVVLKNFKIDATDLVTSTIEIIDITEAGNNLVIIDNVTILGDGTNGYGIEINSNNCRIENCNITYCTRGINILSDSNIIMNNNCSSNAHSGIYLSSADYNNLTSNICNSNIHGIYCDTISGTVMNGNIIKSNSQNGIYLVTSTNNSITSNMIDGNDSNTANPQAGIYIDVNCDNNHIIANSSINNNNSGAGTTYGIYISNANCNDNILNANATSGNDYAILDSGTDSALTYYCSTGQEIQNAIDSIGAKSGTIIIKDGTTVLTATIDIDQNGDYVIEGGGDGSIIDINGDYKGFDITAVNSCILRNFKIDATDLVTSTIEIIDITEASNNRVTIENITISGDGTNGYGIEVNSENCAIKSCTIDNVDRGIHIVANNTSAVSKNDISSCATAGIYVTNADYNKISNNVCTGNADGIYLTGSDNNVITNNVIRTNTLNGIYLTNSDSNKISGNVCDANDSNTANPQAGIHINASDNNTITGNTCTNNNNTGAGNGYGILIVT